MVGPWHVIAIRTVAGYSIQPMVGTCTGRRPGQEGQVMPKKVPTISSSSGFGGGFGLGFFLSNMPPL